MKTKLTALCLCAVFVFLAACRGTPSPGALLPSAEPGPRASAAGLPEPTAEAQPPTISLTEYHAMVSDFNSRVMDESVILIQIGLYEYNWWGSYSGDPNDVDLDAMLQLVMDWLFERFHATPDTIAAVRGALTADYAAIVCANVDGGAPAETSDLVNALFSAYYQLYTTVTQPSGTVREFVRMLCSCTYSITTANADLTAALKTSPAMLHQPEDPPSVPVCPSTARRPAPPDEPRSSIETSRLVIR